MDPRINKVVAAINSDLHQDVKLHIIARSMNISASRLRHMFTAEMGLSPIQYQKSQRIQKARELLQETFFKVKEIIFMIGVKDQSHFARDFKKTCGMSLAQYRTYYLNNTQFSQTSEDISQNGQRLARAASE